MTTMIAPSLSRKLILAFAVTAVLPCTATNVAHAAEKPKLALKASPSLGTPETIFTFRAALTGGEDSEALYCLTTEWEWEEQADASLNEAECPPFKAGETKVERVFNEEQTFQRPGPHIVRVTLRKGDKEIASASTTVTVRKLP